MGDYEWLKKVYDPNAERIMETGAIETEDRTNADNE